MKKGNDDEKIMGPLFPRLHVNDTDKGGPRGPPRNKMALYEQLTVPSQRYNIGAVSINPSNNNNNNNNNLVSSTSASQGIERERNLCFPFYQQPVPPSSDLRHNETASLTNETTSSEKRKRSSDEDDFTVPSFSHPGVGQCKTQNNTHQSPSNPNRRADFKSRQLVIYRDGRSCKVSDSHIKSSDVLTRENDRGSLSDGTYGRGEHQEKQKLNLEGNILGADNIDKVNDNDASGTSIVDSVSGADIFPDDVVGVIGRKHFWKARTAIVNQQRVFAIQVFELHRLIKVQKLIAGSPHLVHEGSAFLSKTSMNDSRTDKYSSDYGVKSQSLTVNHKDNFQKRADKLEGTAENAVMTRVPTPSQNAPHPSFSCPGPVPMPMPVPPVNADPKMNPWGFQQPAVHQWLVPVMTPSEGLVYKPYPPPGMVAPPMYPSPMMGNMMNMPYMLPNPHYHHGMGVPPGGQGCFPAYSMTVMNPNISGSGLDQNQMNQFPGLNQYGGPMSQHQNSCNMPVQMDRSATNALEVVPPNEGELLGSTASSPCERTRTRAGAGGPTTEGTDTLSLFASGPTLEVSEVALLTDKTSRVIKVVPHNPKSTRESAARIFQSIQAERRQHDSS